MAFTNSSKIDVTKKIMRLTKKKLIILPFFFIFFLLNSSLHAHITKITEIRSWDSGEYTRIVFDLDSNVKFEAKKNYDKPISINITFSKCINATGENNFKIKGKLAERITIKKLNNSQVKVYVILIKILNIKFFLCLNTVINQTGWSLI